LPNLRSSYVLLSENVLTLRLKVNRSRMYAEDARHEAGPSNPRHRAANAQVIELLSLCAQADESTGKTFNFLTNNFLHR